MSVNIKLEIRERIETIRHRDEDDKWDRDDIAHDYTIDGYYVVGEKDYCDFELTEDPKGETLYFVYVLYDTGDSFHREDSVMCHIGLYEHNEDAQVVMSALEENYNNDKTRESFDPVEVALPRRGVDEVIGTSTWKGYFEKLVGVYIELVRPLRNRQTRF
jgi:hypothetical protein